MPRSSASGSRHYAGEYPHILSGGEQQRVALARAIAPRPSVLLMDEPFSGLDPRLREKMREETLAILHETRATSIVVTHDAEEAMRMGDRVALMRKGRVVQTGKALDLYRAPKDILAARTFSDLNEIAARIEQGSAATPLGRFAANGLADGAEAIVCVRQRGVRLLAAGAGRAGARARCALPRRHGSGRGRGAGARRAAARPRARRATCRRRAPRSASASIRGAVLVFEAENGERPAARTAPKAAACDQDAPLLP